MSKYAIIPLIATSLLFTSCGGGSSSSSSEETSTQGEAPASVSGLRYLMDIEAGGGSLASTGNAIVVFTDDSNYQLLGDDLFTIDSEGAYTYSNAGAIGIVEFEDTTLGLTGEITMTFTSDTTGNYTVDASDNSLQTGTFASY